MTSRVVCCLQLDRQLQSTQQQMRDAEDEYENSEKQLQEQLRETKEQLSMAQRVLHAFQLLTAFISVALSRH